MKWLLFFQTPYNTNTIKYITDELDESSFFQYYDFINFLKQFKINNKKKMISELDKFETIFLNCDNGEWEVKKQIINIESSFEELYEINKPPIEEEGVLDKSKNFLKNFSRKKGKLNDRTNKNLFVQGKRLSTRYNRFGKNKSDN